MLELGNAEARQIVLTLYKNSARHSSAVSPHPARQGLQMGTKERQVVRIGTVEVKRLCRLKGFVGVWGDREGLVGAAPQGINHLSHLEYTHMGQTSSPPGLTRGL